MKITVNLENGFLADKYGKFADEEWRYKEQPILSFPITITNIPEKTKFLALSFVDYDAVPVCGFPWIHWLAANIPVDSDTLIIPEDFSRKDSQIIQGKNSFISPFVGENDPKITEGYVGPMPPDKDHDYTITVTAFSEKIDLENGFWWNELIKKNTDFATASARLDVKSRS